MILSGNQDSSLSTLRSHFQVKFVNIFSDSIIGVGLPLNFNHKEFYLFKAALENSHVVDTVVCALDGFGCFLLDWFQHVWNLLFYFLLNMQIVKVRNLTWVWFNELLIVIFLIIDSFLRNFLELLAKGFLQKVWLLLVINLFSQLLPVHLVKRRNDLLFLRFLFIHVYSYKL